MQTKELNINVRVTDDTKRMLTELCENTKRSQSNMIIVLVEEAYKKMVKSANRA